MSQEAKKQLGCVLHWNGSTASTNAPKAITSVGDAKQILPFPGAGIGIFDGNGDLLTCGIASDWSFLAGGTWTVECWFYVSSYGQFTFISTYDSDTYTTLHYRCEDTGKIAYGLCTPTGGWWNLNNWYGSETYLLNAWNHVAMVRNGNDSNSTIQCFLNGVLDKTFNIGNTLLKIPTSPLVIGSYCAQNPIYFNGYMSEIRVSNIARYTTNFTPPRRQLESDEHTKLLLHFLGNNATFVDSSPSPKTITAYGNATQLCSPCGSGMLNAVAYTDYLRIPTTSDLTFTDNTDFTIEFWINARTRVNNAGFIVIGNIQYNNTGGWGISEWCTNDTTRYWGYWDNANGWILNGTAYYVENEWSHWAVVRRTEGSNKIFRLFRNGIKVMEATGNGTIGNAGYPFSIGQDPGTPRSTIYLGTTKISELRISNVARYTTDFTPSIQSFKPDPYTKLLLHMDGVGNAFYDSSDAPSDNGFPILPAGVTITPIGTFAVQKLKNGCNSLKFDGSTNYVSIADHAAWTVGAYNFTICLWAKFDAEDALRTLLHLFAATNSGIEIYLSASAKLCLKVSDTSTAGNMVNITGSATIVAATWYHIAVVRNGSAFTVYLNLVSDSTGSSAATVINPTAIALGCRPSGTLDQFMIGNIKDLMIFKGTALSLDQLGQIYDETFIY